jgi:hypothetical protein
MKVEVSNGELIDKLTILEIKLRKIKDKKKLDNIKKEHDILLEVAGTIIDNIHPLYEKLLKINEELWVIEDRIRELEKRKDFGKEFIETARSVYIINDKRARIKQEINQRTNSALFEEKSYEDY